MFKWVWEKVQTFPPSLSLLQPAFLYSENVSFTKISTSSSYESIELKIQGRVIVWIHKVNHYYFFYLLSKRSHYCTTLGNPHPLPESIRSQYGFKRKKGEWEEEEETVLQLKRMCWHQGQGNFKLPENFSLLLRLFLHRRSSLLHETINDSPDVSFYSLNWRDERRLVCLSVCQALYLKFLST